MQVGGHADRQGQRQSYRISPKQYETSGKGQLSVKVQLLRIYQRVMFSRQ